MEVYQEKRQPVCYGIAEHMVRFAFVCVVGGGGAA